MKLEGCVKKKASEINASEEQGATVSLTELSGKERKSVLVGSKMFDAGYLLLGGNSHGSGFCMSTALPALS